MTTIRKATQKDIRVLSRKLLTFLEDKNSQIYQDNVAKSGIPDEYVKTAFAEERLLKAVSSGEAADTSHLSTSIENYIACRVAKGLFA